MFGYELRGYSQKMSKLKKEKCSDIEKQNKVAEMSE
jgi:hypothetical protein